MFWENFIKICGEKELKPTTVIRCAGISTSSISRWQAGGAPNGESIVSLAKFLNCSTDYLLTGSDFKKSDDLNMSFEEIRLIKMYRVLDERAREFAYDSIKSAYDRELKRKEEVSKSLA